MRDDYSKVWEFHMRNFVVTFDVMPEDSDPADHFSFDEDVAAVRDGELEWFQVRIAVWLLDHDGARRLMGADYLGGCAYKTFEDFRTSHFKLPYDSRNTLASKAQGVYYCDYFPGMVRQAVRAAREHYQTMPRLRAA